MKKMQIIGNIGNDAILREVNSSTSINFSVAINETYLNQENVQVNKTIWIGCTIWKNKNQSTEIAKYLTSGTKVYVEGIPEINMYQKENETFAEFKLKVNFIELLSAKQKEENSLSENNSKKNSQEADDDLLF